MKIIVWGPSVDAPPSQAWLARFLDGKRFLPALISGSSEEIVREKVRAFWDAERARYAKRGDTQRKTVEEAFIERVGKPDPVVDEEEGAKGVISADTPVTDQQIDLEEAIAAADDADEDIDLLADL